MGNSHRRRQRPHCPSPRRLRHSRQRLHRLLPLERPRGQRGSRRHRRGRHHHGFSGHSRGPHHRCCIRQGRRPRAHRRRQVFTLPPQQLGVLSAHRRLRPDVLVVVDQGTRSAPPAHHRAI